MSLLSAIPSALKVALPLAAGAALAGAIAWGASGGGGGKRPDARLAPTPTVAVAGDVEATSTPRLGRPTPRPGAKPVKTVLGPRSDCPQGWAFYNDPDGHFSFCYPPGLRTTTGTGVPGGSQGVTVDTPPGRSGPDPNSIVFTVYWKPSSSYRLGLIPDPCATDRLSFGVDVREEQLVVFHGQVLACRGIGKTAYHGIDPLSAEVLDTTDDGWIQIFAFQTGPDVVASGGIIGRIVDSMQMHGHP